MKSDEKSQVNLTTSKTVVIFDYLVAITDWKNL